MPKFDKYGILPPPPVRARTIVRLREGSGKLTDTKALVLGVQPPNHFSRAYGKQAYVCVIHRGQGYVSTVGARDVVPVGKAKRIPLLCKLALEQYESMYPTLARKRTRNRKQVMHLRERERS